MSTYGPVNLPSFISNDADFRSWANGIHTMLSTLGMVNTSDTGQINLTTVARPSANSFGGYEIWRFADTNQGSVPIFFKIEYGVGSPQDRPQLRMTWGTGSNGSGTLTNPTGAQTVVAGSSTTGAGSTNPTFGAAGDGYLAFCSNHDTGNTNRTLVCAIERLRDDAGAATTEGWYALLGGPGGGAYLIEPSGTNTSISFGHVPGLAGKSPSGGNAGFSQGRVFLGRPRHLLGLGRVFVGDLTALSTVAVTALGGTHTYIGIGSNGNAIDNGSSSSSDARAMIWE